MSISRRAALTGLALAPFAGATGVFAATDERGDPDVILKRAMADLQAKNAANARLWEMNKSSWNADLDLGTITFSNPRHWTITAPVQVIGTRATTDGSWLWAWDHPYIPAKLAVDVRLVREFGVVHKIDDFTTRKVTADEERCWLFTALACYLAGASGAYRGPADKVEVFMTFGEVTISK